MWCYNLCGHIVFNMGYILPFSVRIKTNLHHQPWFKNFQNLNMPAKEKFVKIQVIP